MPTAPWNTQGSNSLCSPRLLGWLDPQEPTGMHAQHATCWQHSQGTGEAVDMVPCQRVSACQATGSRAGRRREERGTPGTDWVYLPAENRSRLTACVTTEAETHSSSWLWSMAVKHKKCKKQRYLEPSHSTVQCCVAWLTGFSKWEALCAFSPLMHRKSPGRLKSWFLESKDPKGFWTSTMAAADFIAVLQELSSLRIVFEGARGRRGPQHWEANTGTLCSSENCPQTGEVQLRQL